MDKFESFDLFSCYIKFIFSLGYFKIDMYIYNYKIKNVKRRLSL